MIEIYNSIGPGEQQWSWIITSHQDSVRMITDEKELQNNKLLLSLIESLNYLAL